MTLLSRGSRIKRDIGRADERAGRSSGDKTPSEALFVLALLHLLFIRHPVNPMTKRLWERCSTPSIEFSSADPRTLGGGVGSGMSFD